MLPIGLHVEIVNQGPPTYGQIHGYDNDDYVVRIGGTDQTRKVRAGDVRVHPALAANLELHLAHRLPIGIHVEVNDGDGTYYGQVEGYQADDYQVRVGGTSRINRVRPGRVSLHPMFRALPVERQRDALDRLLNLQINFVWLGTERLRPLELFNVYSWRALGHNVTIYAFHFTGRHTVESLGLLEGAAKVVDLPALIRSHDELATNEAPDEAGYLELLKKTARMRSVIKAWYEAVKPTGNPIEHIYNMVDITKSYVAATRRGIVLDLKIGPSEHVKRCEDKGVFDHYFVSYRRGSSTPIGMPENQCMGSMQREHDLRRIYGERFNEVLGLYSADTTLANTPTGQHFNQLTSYHGRGWQRLGKKALDVADRGQMEKVGLYKMELTEISDETSYGPFRVFKRKADQTNTSLASTTALEQIELCEYACLKAQQLGLVVKDEFHTERKKVVALWKARL